MEAKITHYRQAQRQASRLRTHLSIEQCQLQPLLNTLKTHMRQEMEQYQRQVTSALTSVEHYYESQLRKQAQLHEQDAAELRNEIKRQYQVITSMRREVEDLQELIIMQNAAVQARQEGEGEVHSEGNSDVRTDTINGLEVIEEEDTERTLLSVRSGFDQDNFIRIEDRPEEGRLRPEDLRLHDSGSKSSCLA